MFVCVCVCVKSLGEQRGTTGRKVVGRWQEGGWKVVRRPTMTLCRAQKTPINERVEGQGDAGQGDVEQGDVEQGDAGQGDAGRATIDKGEGQRHGAKQVRAQDHHLESNWLSVKPGPLPPPSLPPMPADCACSIAVAAVAAAAAAAAVTAVAAAVACCLRQLLARSGSMQVSPVVRWMVTMLTPGHRGPRSTAGSAKEAARVAGTAVAAT